MQELERQARAQSDTAAAEMMQAAKTKAIRDIPQEADGVTKRAVEMPPHRPDDNAGKVEIQRQDFHFPTGSNSSF